jgi:arabinogalactan oligomer/maltooligosaccharide transport system substrate-binding protein
MIANGKSCPRCGTQALPNRLRCASCGAALDPQAAEPRALNEAWEASKLRKSLSGSGMWSIMWGALALIAGLAMIEESALNVVLAGIGVFLIGTGIAAWAAPNPVTLRLDATALLLVGLWNIIATLAGGESSEMVWIIGGVVQIGWAIGRFARHGRFKEVQHVPLPLIKHAAELVRDTQRANAGRDAGIVQFRAAGKLWKVRLLPDLAVAVAGNAQEVRFVEPDEFKLSGAPEATTRWVQANIQLGRDTWTGPVFAASLAQYALWRQARDAEAGEAPAAEAGGVPAAQVGKVPGTEAVEASAAPRVLEAAVVATPQAERALPAAPPAAFPAPAQTATPEQPRAALWPPAAALLNLSGLGLGYLGMRRWGRWIVHAVLTAIVVLIGLRLPSWAGLSLVGVWLLWMAVDGWRQARKGGADLGPGKVWHSWAPAAAALLVLGLEIGGAAFYRLETHREFVRGRTAYELAAVERASTHLQRVVSRAALADAQEVQEARAQLQEIEALQAANTARQKGNYEAAIEGYQAHAEEHARSPLTDYARAEMAGTYADWGRAQCAEGQYLQALETLAQGYPADEDEVMPAALARAYQEAVFGLAQDDGEDGSKAIQASWTSICEGGAATSQAVGLLSDQAALMWYRGRDIEIPKAWQADTPGQFRYAVCLREDLEDISSCRYFPAGTVHRQRVEWRITVRDTVSGELVAAKTFAGGTPKDCPSTWVFYGNSRTGTLKGSNPEEAAIQEWLGAIAEGEAPAAEVAIEPVRATPTPAVEEDEGERKAEPTPTKLSSGPVELTVAHNWGGEQNEEALQELTQRYMDLHPQVEVEILSTHESDVIEAMLVAGEVDVVLASVGMMKDWAERGNLAPLTPFVDQEWMRETYIDSAVNTVTYQGTLYGLPVQANVLALIYNRDLIADQDVPENTHDLLQQAAKWDASDHYFVFDTQTYYWAAGWFHGGEARFVDDECQPKLDTPDGVAAAELIAAFREIMPEDASYTVAMDLFDQGKLAMTIDGPWARSRLEDAGIDYGVAPLPALSGTDVQPAPYVDFGVWMLTTRTDKKDTTEAAWDLIRYCASAEAQQFLADELDAIPATRPEGEPEGWQRIAERGTPMPSARCMSAVWGALNNMLQEIWAGEDPSKAVTAAQNELEKAVAQ